MPNIKKIPVLILQDASYSTRFIQEILDEQMRRLITSLKEHAFADRIVLMAAHYDDQYKLIKGFTDISVTDAGILDLKNPMGATNTGEAVERTLDILNAQLDGWESLGVSYSCPIFLLVTDGHVSPGRCDDWSLEVKAAFEREYKKSYEAVARRVRELMASQKLIFGAAGIWHSAQYRANMDELKKLTGCEAGLFNPKVRFNSELDFAGPIEWLMNAVTRSATEDLSAN